MQYKNWRAINLAKPPGEQENVTQFITKWVLPGMLPEQIDIALRNRAIYNKDNIVRMGSFLNIPKHVPLYESELDNAMSDVMDDLCLLYTSPSPRD